MQVQLLSHTIVLYHPQLKRYTRYAHLLAKSIQVKVGQVLKSGQTIAMIGGSSGNGRSAWSPHLHFDVIKKYEGLQMWNGVGNTLKAHMDYVKDHYEDPLIFLGKQGILPPGMTQAQFEREVPAALRNTRKPSSGQPPAPQNQSIPITGRPVLPSGAGGYTLTNQQLNNLRRLQENGTLKWAVSLPEKLDASFTYMTLSEKGALEIRGGEGASADPYEDSQGYMTIGYGHLIDKDTDGRVSRAEWDAYDKLGFPRGGLTPAQQLALYQIDLKPAIDAVNAALKKPVTQEMFDALVSITFNHGKHFPNNSYGRPLFESINRGDYSKVPDLFYQYNLSGGKPVKGLKNRRLKEVTTFATPYIEDK